jgi:hypothetical protein
VSIPYYYGHLSEPVASPLPLFIQLTGGTASDDGGSPSRAAIAGWWHGATGKLEKQEFLTYTRNALNWGGGVGFDAADYEVKADWVGNALKSDSTATGVWLNAAFNYKWRLEVLAGNTQAKNGTLTLTIRDVATQTQQAQDDYVITVEGST